VIGSSDRKSYAMASNLDQRLGRPIRRPSAPPPGVLADEQGEQLPMCCLPG
jgi:hypothetical protein